MDILKTPQQKLMEEVGVNPATPGMLKTPQQLLLEEAGVTRKGFAQGGEVNQMSPEDMLAELVVGGQQPQKLIPPVQSKGQLQNYSNLQAFINATLGGAPITQAPPIKNEIKETPVSFYRHNPHNLFGAKDKLETMPSTVDKETLNDFVSAMRAGEKYGVPQLPPEYLASMLMKEGRSDFGYNKFDKNNQKAQIIAEKLMQEGFDPDSAGFGAALYDKMQVANRLKIPFATAWNGLGVNRFGKSGQEYAKEISSGFEAVINPRNQPLLNTIKEAYNYQQQSRGTSPQKFADGGAVQEVNRSLGTNYTPSYNPEAMVGPQDRSSYTLTTRDKIAEILARLTKNEAWSEKTADELFGTGSAGMDPAVGYNIPSNVIKGVTQVFNPLPVATSIMDLPRNVAETTRTEGPGWGALEYVTTMFGATPYIGSSLRNMKKLGQKLSKKTKE